MEFFASLRQYKNIVSTLVTRLLYRNICIRNYVTMHKFCYLKTDKIWVECHVCCIHTVSNYHQTYSILSSPNNKAIAVHFDFIIYLLFKCSWKAEEYSCVKHHDLCGHMFRSIFCTNNVNTSSFVSRNCSTFWSGVFLFSFWFRCSFQVLHLFSAKAIYLGHRNLH